VCRSKCSAALLLAGALEAAGSSEEAISVIVDGLMGWPGGPQAWVAEHGGSAGDVRRWRQRLAR